jgi:hypothetical protein
MTEEERIYERASLALGELVARDVALETESIIAHDAGDYSISDAADAAKTALAPNILKAEENVYHANIASNKAAKASVSQHIRRDAGNCSPQQIEELLASMTRTFDDDIWKTEQQLANNLNEQVQFSRASNV